MKPTLAEVEEAVVFIESRFARPRWAQANPGNRDIDLMAMRNHNQELFEQYVVMSRLLRDEVCQARDLTKIAA